MSLDSTAATRLNGFDAARSAAFLLTVVFHAAVSFLPGPKIWVTHDVSSTGILYLFITAHMSHMLIFFVLAGFFARARIERRGVGSFVRDRALRITLPAIVFWPLLMAGVLAVDIWAAGVTRNGVVASALPKMPIFSIRAFPLLHLWFLYALTLACAVAAICVGIGKRLDRDGDAPRRVVDRATRWLAGHHLTALLLAVPMAALFAAWRRWSPPMGIPAPDQGFRPNGIATGCYGLAFLLGWLMQRQPILLKAWQRGWFGHCFVAALASALLLMQIKPESFGALVPGAAHRAELAFLYAVAAWCWTIGLIGAGLRLFDRENRVIRYISDASYWSYIVHFPVVMALQVLVWQIEAPALAKFAMVLGGALLVVFASYHLLVRHSWLGQWLNGRRRPWRGTGTAGTRDAAIA